MRFRTLPPIVALALVSVGCGVSGNDDEADSSPTTAAAANDNPADTTGDPQPIAANDNPADTTADPQPIAANDNPADTTADPQPIAANDNPADTTADPQPIAANDETADTTGDPLPIAAASAEVEPYFRAVETSALTLSVAVEGLFSTPQGFEVEQIAERLYADGTPSGDITAAEEATLREFFTTFWTDAAGHVDVLGDDLRALDPPDAVRAQHDAYVAALDAIVDSTDERVAEISTRDVADLPDILWEPDDDLAAMEAACAALDAEGARMGIDAETCPQ